MVRYSQFNTTPDHAYNIARALRYCHETGADGLCFDKGEYRIRAALASEAVLAMSNHGDPTLKRICFLLRGFKNFTLDGGDSTFVFEDIVQPLAMLDCEGVTVQNMTFLSLETKNAQAEIVRAEGNWMDVRLYEGTKYFISDGDLKIGEDEKEPQFVFYFDEYDATTGWFVEKHAEYMARTRDGGILPHLTFSLCEDGCIHVEGLRRPFKAGNRVVLGTESRCIANMFANRCVNTTVRGVTVFSGIGMGLIAQNCDGVEVDRMATRIAKGRLFSINSDATHFVHCKGLIHVHDCHFEGQHDDAINVHSIYLKVVEKRERSVIVRYMHPESRGIGIFHAGARAAVIDPATLFSRGELDVEDVIELNVDNTEIVFAQGADLSIIEEGDCLHETSYHPTVIFERNVMLNNRARGVLLDGGADYTLRDNLFRTPGPAVRFGGEASYWYETCGGETVLLENNIFDNCAYAGWGLEVIGGRSYPHADGQYIHGALTVRGNVFRNCDRPLAALYGFSSVTFEGNTLENCPTPTVKCQNCGEIALQDEVR